MLAPEREVAADDAFWGTVSALARAAGADLLLLEGTGEYSYNWIVLPASGDVTATRAELWPGTQITVFAQPPSAAFPVPAGAGPFHGFIDGAYHAVGAGEVPAFLAEAGGARRWGLYASDDPSALHAVVPARLDRPAYAPPPTLKELIASGAPVAEPPARWEVQTSVLIAFVIIAAVAGLAISAVYFAVAGAVGAGDAGSLPVWAQDMIVQHKVVDSVYFATVLAYLAALQWWRGATRNVLLVFAGGDLRSLASPLMRGWTAFIAVALVLRFFNERLPVLDADGLESMLRLDGLSAALRVLGLLCLLAGIWHTRARVRAAVAGVR